MHWSDKPDAPWGELDEMCEATPEDVITVLKGLTVIVLATLVIAGIGKLIGAAW
jgi:hypothetical protein